MDENSRGLSVAPVVYRDDALDSVLRALESLMVVASDSMQHQLLSELYRGFATMLPRLPAALAAEAEALLLRSLSALGDHVPTRELDAALTSLTTALKESARPEAAEAVTAAQARLAANIGSLQSRATRAVE